MPYFSPFDPFRRGSEGREVDQEKLKQDHYTLWDAADWKYVYGDAGISVTFDIRLRSTGALF
ncbi:hypothetical protein [Paenibacillus sp. PL2-23]|uniref:hypothetical protein n=1 Tax=Paenibacillus sp. PL2-23 TaxID=2100729 RepID=UPI0030FC0439